MSADSVFSKEPSPRDTDPAPSISALKSPARSMEALPHQTALTVSTGSELLYSQLVFKTLHGHPSLVYKFRDTFPASWKKVKPLFFLNGARMAVSATPRPFGR